MVHETSGATARRVPRHSPSSSRRARCLRHSRRQSSESSLARLPLALLATLLVGSSDAQAWAGEGGEALFQNKCVGCHANGGNVLAAGKGLQIQDLERNQVAAIEDVVSITYYGKNKMPGFGEKCAPAGKCTFAARLTDAEVRDVSQYVLQRAQEGWN
ncbi:cytochrome c [Chloropicon primus]|uniref:Cytochrome c-553 n=1 Tax=Chloropicon primus TaxID=1764295 RepID=A0A5B8MXU5_9CHLO|nr:cytochrome c [Chloropicon primus]|mmetsp:Transcript_34086/g.73832  ORF Transcript_34086/g.73832 Transcript_34086/m.73832 type:complete len:158 (-) Transcript_34086:16-489(-)|eukprot:QDZ24362.1 cytochrome c [Chloropicon primus]